jgi:regulator of protease activity HflC (stomatin/prohibitin superfamily)
MTQTASQPKLIRWMLLVLLGIIVLLVMSRTTFLTIDPGYAGVLFKRFGGGIDKEKIYQQGFHVIAPWNKMFVYDIRIKEHYEKMEVLSKNGLTIVCELSIRYRAKPDKIGYLHNEIGTRYLESIVIPEIRSATREVIGKYLPEELYSSKREAIQVEIFDRTFESVESKHVYVDAILIRGVTLPQTLQDAIERKLKEEQAALEYDFRLDRERKEAERKIIEAQAKSDANRILNASLTANILRDKGIEATLELAQSPNSKIVIVGSGKDGLPLILGNQ